MREFISKQNICLSTIEKSDWVVFCKKYDTVVRFQLQNDGTKREEENAQGLICMLLKLGHSSVVRS